MENNMENLTQRQLILLIVLVAVVVSVATSIGMAVFLYGEEPETVVERIIEREKGETQQLINEKILRQDELVVAVVKQTLPGVVSIVAAKDVPVVEQYFVDPFGDDPFFRQFFGEQFQVPQLRQKGTRREDVSKGSGFVASSDGLILTNKHVVEDAKADYTVFLHDGTKISARVLGKDPVQDIAVLKISPPAKGLTVLRLGDSDNVEIGQSVIAIGNALGEFQDTVSVGIVSGLGRSITARGGSGAEELEGLIQTDAAINPGNSGGPILNLRGEVIGTATAIAQGAENIGFAIPINRAKRDIASVKASGKIIYPFIGIRYAMLNDDLKDQNKLSVGSGAWIVGGEGEPAITKGSPAEKAGLKEGDIILKINNDPVTRDHPIAEYLQKYQAGETIVLRVLRGEKETDVRLTLEERKF